MTALQANGLEAAVGVAVTIDEGVVTFSLGAGQVQAAIALIAVGCQRDPIVSAVVAVLVSTPGLPSIRLDGQTVIRRLNQLGAEA